MIRTKLFFYRKIILSIKGKIYYRYQLFKKEKIRNIVKFKGTNSLPNLLITLNRSDEDNKSDWIYHRRSEILNYYLKQIYGKCPNEYEVSFEVVRNKKSSMHKNAVIKEINIIIRKNSSSHKIDLLLFLPVKRNYPAPIFVGLNFYGNHTISEEPIIRITKNWVPNNKKVCVENNNANHFSRGVRAEYWPVDKLLSRGYGLATIYCGDLCPDNNCNYKLGVQPIFFSEKQTKPERDQWGALSVWAWGLSRAMDYFLIDKDVDNSRVAVVGFSRLGKAALWAGAQDVRFSLSASINSGCGGASLFRRKFGETVKDINSVFPYMFCENFKQYNDREKQLPIDQHMLISLIAPRSVYIASAEKDYWADPYGEFLSAKKAEPIYNLYGLPGLGDLNFPEINKSINNGCIGYHVRSGKHGVTDFDWSSIISFADLTFNKNRSIDE